VAQLRALLNPDDGYMPSSAYTHAAQREAACCVTVLDVLVLGSIVLYDHRQCVRVSCIAGRRLLPAPSTVRNPGTSRAFCPGALLLILYWRLAIQPYSRAPAAMSMRCLVARRSLFFRCHTP
jgi:hypothetical protein